MKKQVSGWKQNILAPTSNSKKKTNNAKKKKDGTNTSMVSAPSATSDWMTSRNSHSTTPTDHKAPSCALTATPNSLNHERNERKVRKEFIIHI